MRVEGAAMREQLQAGANIHDVGGVDLAAFERQHIHKITKIQANVRGHLARKQLARPPPLALSAHEVCTLPSACMRTLAANLPYIMSVHLAI